MDLKQLIEYQTEGGKSPFHEWLFSKRLDTRTRDRVLIALDKLSLGNSGDCKAVGRGVVEMRLHFGPGYRIYFGRKGETVVILLCGGDKASQKRDIHSAQCYWLDYLRRAGQ